MGTQVALSLVLLSIITLFTLGEGYKILFMATMESPSHKIMFNPFIAEMAKRNHEVTVISQFPLPKPIQNVKEITIDRGWQADSTDFSDWIGNHHPLTELNGLIGFTMMMCKSVLESSKVKELLKAGKQFDVVVVDNCFNDCSLGVSTMLSRNVITLNAMVVLEWSSVFVPQPPSYLANYELPYPSSMNFFQRLNNAIIYTGYKLYFYFYAQKIFNAEFAKHFPESKPLSELVKLPSYHLHNADPIFVRPSPSMPNIARVGGLQCREAKALPKDLDDFVQSSGNDGFIYFSLGTNFKSAYLPDKSKKALLSAFSKLKQKVIWKFEDKLDNLPANVKIVKWAPQQDLLGHSKIQAFITHGGLMSSLEIVYHGVPCIIIPIFVDQPANAARHEELGIGITLSFFNITEENVLAAMNTILTKRYKETAKKYSAIVRDQYETPLKRAADAVEYVIRHDGAPSLRSVAESYCLFKYLGLDVLGFVLIILVFVIWILLFMLKFLVKKFRRVNLKKKTQ